jgi:hypothetical protein
MNTCRELVPAPQGEGDGGRGRMAAESEAKMRGKGDSRCETRGKRRGQSVKGSAEEKVR